MVERDSVGWKSVDLLLVNELQAMLDSSQFAVGLGHRSGIIRIDVPRVGQLSEHRKGVRSAKLAIEMAVHQLQKLNSEFDISDSPRASFELAVSESLSRYFGLGSGFHCSE